MPANRADQRLTRSQHGVLIFVSGLALALRLAYLWGQSRNNPLFLLPKVDAYWHHEWAQQIASGQGMDPEPYYRAPLYYYLLGGLYWLVGPSVAWARLVGGLLGTATTYLISRLGVALGGFRVGVLSGLLAALYWPAIYFDGELLTASLECLLGVALLLSLLRAGKGDGVLSFLGVGLVWGLSAIARPNFLALAPVILLWLFLLAPKSVAPGRRLARAAMLVLGLALAVLPVTLRNLSASGEPVLISYSGGLNFYIGNNPDSGGISPVVPGTRRSLKGGFRDARRIPQAELGRKLSAQETSDYWSSRAMEWIWAEPVAWTEHMLYKARLFFSPMALPNNQPIWFFASMSGISVLFWLGFPLIACLAVASFFPLRARWREWFLPWGFAVTYMASVILFFVNARYRLPIYPVLTVTAAAGLVEVFRRARSGHLRGLVPYLFATLAMGLFIATNPPFERESFRAAGEGEGHGILGHYYASIGGREAGNHERALTHFEEAVRLKPGSPNLRIALAKQYLLMQRSGDAERVMSRTVERFPDVAEVRFEYGRLLARQDRDSEAIRELSLATRLRPTYAEAHQAIGCRLGAMMRSADAEEHLLQAIAMDPALLDAKFCLARLRIGQGRYDEATGLYLQVQENAEASTRALVGLGDVSMLAHRPDEAIRYYRAALARAPNLPDASQNLAAALRSTGAHHESQTALERGIKASPADLPLRIQLAWSFATSPDPGLRDGQKALFLAREAATSQTPPSVEALDALAAAYAELGRFEEAIRTAEVGLQLARSRGGVEKAIAVNGRLKLYRSQRPFHQAPRPSSPLRHGSP